MESVVKPSRSASSLITLRIRESGTCAWHGGGAPNPRGWFSTLVTFQGEGNEEGLGEEGKTIGDLFTF